jgi:hypothetical protein
VEIPDWRQDDQSVPRNQGSIKGSIKVAVPNADAKAKVKMKPCTKVVGALHLPWANGTAGPTDAFVLVCW